METFPAGARGRVGTAHRLPRCRERYPVGIAHPTVFLMVPAVSPVAPSLSAALAASRERIDAALDDYTRFGPVCPAKLADAIRYSLLAPGKRLRPILVLWSAAACGCPVESALPAACAVEMIHTYSLVHDDLPAMDDDDLRRGRPTCHKVYGEANAILVGDALLALAFETLARVRPAETAAACVAALARAAGATALVGGQADDLAAAANAPRKTTPARTTSTRRATHWRRSNRSIAARPGRCSSSRCNSAGWWPAPSRATAGARKLRPPAGSGIPDRRRPAGCQRRRSGARKAGRQGFGPRKAHVSRSPRHRGKPKIRRTIDRRSLPGARATGQRRESLVELARFVLERNR